MKEHLYFVNILTFFIDLCSYLKLTIMYNQRSEPETSQTYQPYKNHKYYLKIVSMLHFIHFQVRIYDYSVFNFCFIE